MMESIKFLKISCKLLLLPSHNYLDVGIGRSYEVKLVVYEARAGCRLTIPNMVRIAV